MKCVVLTGVSGGMGLATLNKLVNNDFFVYGLDIKEPENKEISNFKFVQCDLTDENSVQKAFKIISKEDKKLDAIISMAGIYDLNSLIEMSEEDFVRIFNINLFGVFRLNKFFVPLLKEKGKVVIVSSELAPLDPLPFTGIYGITKSAVEKYAFSLRMELQLLNKQVVVIRPGAVNTSLLDVSTQKIEKFSENTANFKYNAERFKRITNKVEARKIAPEKIANLTNKIVLKKKPKYIYKINRNPLLLLMHMLPKHMQNWLIKKILLKK